MSVSPILAASTIVVGGYISIWKCAVLLGVLLIWARLLTWTDKDAEAAHLPRVPLNVGFILGLLLALGLFLFLPGFVIACPVLVLIFFMEIAAYLLIRNQKVGLSDLSKQFKAWLGGFKPKAKGRVGKKGEVLLASKSGTVIDLPEGNDPETQAQIAGYQALQDIFTEPLKKKAERIEVAAGEQRSTVRYWVDGMGYDGLGVAKNDVSSAIAMLKDAMGLDTNDRRKPQSGVMKATVDGVRNDLRVLAAGSTTGESMIVDINWTTRHELKIDQLGFTPEQLKVVQKIIADPAGIVLLATPKGQGLTTLEYAFLRSHDAFLTHIQTVERAPEVELEGITQNALPASATAQDEAKQVNWVCSQEPDIIMISRIEDPRSAADINKYAGNGKRAYIGIRAGSTFEALEVWKKMIGDEKLAMKNLKLVIAGRVMRKLCDACKIDYTPDPDTLRKMNMPADKVGKLYTARTTPLKDSRGNTVVCEFCLDLRFRGRTGAYELFIIDDDVRQAFAQGGTAGTQLKMVFKKQKQRYLQEVALAKAVAGDTSLHEVARVLKATSTGSSSSGGARPSSGGGKPPTGGPRPSTKPPTSSSRSAPPSSKGSA